MHIYSSKIREMIPVEHTDLMLLVSLNTTITNAGALPFIGLREVCFKYNAVCISFKRAAAPSFCLTSAATVRVREMDGGHVLSLASVYAFQFPRAARHSRPTEQLNKITIPASDSTEVQFPLSLQCGIQVCHFMEITHQSFYLQCLYLLPIHRYLYVELSPHQPQYSLWVSFT